MTPEIQFKPAFSEDQRPIAVTMPEDIDREGALEAEVRAGISEFAAEFLRQFAEIGDAQTIGRTVIVLAYLAGLTNLDTKEQVARRLKISPGRLSQILQGIPGEFKSLANLKNRSQPEQN